MFELQINTRACLALWHIRNPELGRVTVAGVVRAMRANLMQDEVLEEKGVYLHLSVSHYSRNRCTLGWRVRVVSGEEYGRMSA